MNITAAPTNTTKYILTVLMCL